MPTAMHKIIKAAVLPPRQNADYGVSFEFDDGWIAAHFQLTKAEAERQAPRVVRASPCPIGTCVTVLILVPRNNGLRVAAEKGSAHDGRLRYHQGTASDGLRSGNSADASALGGPLSRPSSVNESPQK